MPPLQAKAVNIRTQRSKKCEKFGGITGLALKAESPTSDD